MQVKLVWMHVTCPEPGSRGAKARSWPACSFRWFIMAESTVCWFIMREKQCGMATDLAE
jgi:hypothetical protein